MAASKVEGKIKPIDRTAIHRICSGQVVLDLATAVKELVENSLDAGATSIDIRLKDHGAELIEVADNGSGVSPENFQALTLKYHTSKISKFVDLQSLSSFGFRGEALSSLCALAKVIVVTRTKDEPIAVRLEYDHSGLIVSQENVARSVGTTVSVAKLFSPLPVRFKEFRRENNIRREYGRLLSVLQAPVSFATQQDIRLSISLKAYALISNGVRLICSNQTGRAGRTIAVQTQGNTSMRDNVVTVFGTKTAACMQRLDLSVSDNCSLEGFVSKPGAGCGRPSGDRQFFYVNGRPVDMPKVSKLLNELYRSFNSLQYPMLVLNFVLPTTAYDVNVTPDKRKLFLHSEGELMVALRDSLEKVYAPTKYTFTLNNVESAPLLGKVTATGKKHEGSRKRTDLSFQSNVPQDASSDDENESDTGEGDVVSLSKVVGESDIGLSSRAPLNLLSFKHPSTKELIDKELDGECGTGSSYSSTTVEKLLNPPPERKIQVTLTDCVSQMKRTLKGSGGDLLSEEPLLKRWRPLNPTDGEVDEDDREGSDDCELGVSDKLDNDELQATGEPNKKSAIEDKSLQPSTGVVDRHGDPTSNTIDCVRRMMPCSNGGLGTRPPLRSSVDLKGKKEKLDLGRNVAEAHKELDSFEFQHHKPDMYPKPVQTSKRKNDQAQRAELSASIRSAVDPAKDGTQIEELGRSVEGRPIVQFDMDNIQKKFDLGLLRGQMTANLSLKEKHPRRRRCFEAATLNGIGNGVEKEVVLEAATKELERSFNKADFKQMKVLGQFNLGFILAKIDQDIFIIDQHASDEKYNFERLSKTTVLNRQPLLRPLRLELSAAEEMTVVSHMETFRQNGFDFVADEDTSAGQRLQLTAVPFSQNVTFGVGDVQELISLLADEPVMSFKCATNHDESTCDHGVGKLPRKPSNWLPRPSRVRTMLASRACRSSIMIGDPLSKKEMERILSHLAELDSPWNCPHGRPTMRHLVDLSTINP